MKTISVGEIAPLFTLLDENNNEVALADFIGKKTSACLFLSKSNDARVYETVKPSLKN